MSGPSPIGRTAAALALIFVTCTALNLTKAVHVDDTVYLLIARGIIDRPLHPMSAPVNWVNTVEPAATAINSPPLFISLMALVMKLTGESELALHALMALVTLGAIVVFHAIARRVAPDHALFATAIFSLGPAFLPGQNIMQDVPNIALALLCFLSLLKARDSARWYLLAAVAASAAVMVKYTSLVLLPVFAAALLFRRDKRHAWTLAIPIATLAGWCLFNIADYGQAHMFHLPINDHTPAGIVHSLMLWVTGFGAIAPFAVMYYFRPPRKQIGMVAAALAAALCFAMLPRMVEHRDPYREALWILMLANGTFFLVTLIVEAARYIGATWRGLDVVRAENAMLLFLWGAGAAVFIVLLNIFHAVRHILPAVPAFVLLACACYSGALTPRRKAICLAATLALGAPVAVSDYTWASVYRDAAPRLARDYAGSGTMWSIGHWGWQWYAEKAGMKTYDAVTTELQPGDRVVIAHKVHGQTVMRDLRKSGRRVGREVIPFTPLCWLRTMGGVPTAGLYAHHMIRSACPPWHFSRASLETFSIWEVTSTNRLPTSATPRPAP